ncbi:MAG TPA: type 1 glutamine amidotransferase family protein [Polyangia bacterium]|nr:type 1 glutamine amidotransferase family protein [Polyangia bacterium]
MQTIYHYVLPTMADWETGYAVAELRSQRYFKRKRAWQVKTVGATREPVTTLGGLTIVPDVAVSDLSTADAVLLILPGADTWREPAHGPVVEKARALLKAHVPVAAICGATAALAEAGLLDRIQHTSNGLPFLKMTCPHYRGEALYRNELAVTDGDVITAGSSSPVEFAREILKKLEALEPQHLEYWYGYFGQHSVDSFLALFEAMKGTAAR